MLASNNSITSMLERVDTRIKEKGGRADRRTMHNSSYAYCVIYLAVDKKTFADLIGNVKSTKRLML